MSENRITEKEFSEALERLSERYKAETVKDSSGELDCIPARANCEIAIVQENMVAKYGLEAWIQWGRRHGYRKLGIVDRHFTKTKEIELEGKQ